MSSPKAKGFAIRRNNTCLADEQACPKTWDTWTACCPHNSYCPGKDKRYNNNICCPDSSNCTALITHPAICADSSWNLYAWNGKDETGGWFCCEQNQQGFYVSGQAYVGCAGPGVAGNPNFIYLEVKKKGTLSATSSSTTTTSVSTIDSTATTPPNEPSSSPHNIDVSAIAGSVVGGVVGLALIIIAAFFFFRHRKRQPSPQETKSGIELSEQTSYFAELDPMTPPAELIGSSTRGEVIYELPGSQ